MGIAQILSTQEYTHEYCMWKSIASNELTWVSFEAHLQEAYLDREELEKKPEVACYSSVNNVKHGKMEDAFMNFASVISARDSAIKKLITKNRNLSTQSRQKEYQIRELQEDI